MTLRKSTTRPRRTTAAADGIPAGLATFFEFGGSPPWDALIPPHHALLREHWKAWAAEHRGAVPPTGWEWIASPAPATMHGQPYEEAIEKARSWARVAARNRKATT